MMEGVFFSGRETAYVEALRKHWLAEAELEQRIADLERENTELRKLVDKVLPKDAP